MNYYEKAMELKEETIMNRRYIHKNAETGLDLPRTKAFVMEKLKEYGLGPKDCGYGVTATHLEKVARLSCFVRIWMRFQCRKKVENPLRVLPVQKPMHVVMIFMQLCF